MPVMDEFKEERETIKNAPFSKKLEYFKDYYLLKTILVLAVLGLLGSLIMNWFSKKEIVLYVTLVNFNLIQESSDGLIAPFAEENINTKKEEIFLDSSSYISSDSNEINFIKYSYEDEQRLFSMVMTGDLDLFISGGDVIARYAEQQWFEDLDTVIRTEGMSAAEEDAILYWNGTPVAVKIPESSILMKYYAYNGNETEAVYAAFPTGSTHRRLAVLFLSYLLENGEGTKK